MQPVLVNSSQEKPSNFQINVGTLEEVGQKENAMQPRFGFDSGQSDQAS